MGRRGQEQGNEERGQVEQAEPEHLPGPAPAAIHQRSVQHQEQEDHAEDAGHARVEGPSKPHGNQRQAHDEKKKRRDRHPDAGRPVPMDDGEDLHARRAVLVSPEHGDGQKVRDLPRDQEREEEQSARVQPSGDGRPPHQRGERSGDGAEHQRPGGPRLERGIRTDVTHERENPEREGQQIAPQREHVDGQARQEHPERQADVRREASGSQRSVSGPRHEPVPLPLHPAVQRVRRADEERRAEQGAHPGRGPGRAGSEPHAARQGAEHEGGEPRLGQGDEIQDRSSCERSGGARRLVAVVLWCCECRKGHRPRQLCNARAAGDAGLTAARLVISGPWTARRGARHDEPPQRPVTTPRADGPARRGIDWTTRLVPDVRARGWLGSGFAPAVVEALRLLARRGKPGR